MEGTEELEDVGYLQDIIAYIFDEKRIVTYKWISNVLTIHVNRAKQLLYTFLKHLAKERLKDLKVTYLVGGVLPDNKGCRIQVVSEEDLGKVKSLFKVVTSEHVYSVSLKNCLTDLQSICSVDGVKDCAIGRNGAVQCLKGVPRTSQEVLSKRQGAYKAVDDDKKWPSLQPKQAGDSEKSSKVNGGITSMFSVQNNKGKAENNTNSKAPAGGNEKSSKVNGGIASMFSAQNNKGKTEENTNPKKSEEVKIQNASSPEKKTSSLKNNSKGGKPAGGRLAAMFSAQNAKPKPLKKDNEESVSKNKKESTEEETPVIKNDSECDNRAASVSKDAPKKSSKDKNSKSGSRKSKKRKASDNEEKNKKRKRIVVMDSSDSSSDDVFGSDDEEQPASPVPLLTDEEVQEEIEAKPLEETIAEIDKKGHHGRKRHLVDKTFVDEEGYLVTKKVYEFVSCSESENEEEKENEKTGESKAINKEAEKTSNTKVAEKPQKKSSQKKNSSPEKKKQASLMSFFKRS